MKYFLPIIAIIFLGLTGCNKNTNQDQTTFTGEQLFSSAPINTGFAQFTESDFFSGTYLGGIYAPIFISGNRLVISGAFSFSLPKEITYKLYSTQYTPITKSYYERIGFTNEEKNTSFTIHISKLVRPSTTYTPQELCKIEYPDGYLSRSETIKNIQNQDIYVYYATLMTSGPDIEPQKIINTEFCLTRNGMLYKFNASNYTHTYMNDIVDSFTFLD